MQALTHIAKKLEQLHSSGWVHRDIKPGNILRLPKVHGWTLMDFGCAARTGARPSALCPAQLSAEAGPSIEPRALCRYAFVVTGAGVCA